VSFYVLVKDPVDRAGMSGTGAKALGRKPLPAAGGGHKMLHSTFIAQLLNDLYGIQVRPDSHGALHSTCQLVAHIHGIYVHAARECAKRQALPSVGAYFAPNCHCEMSCRS
jgi:hypothetical protein